MALPTIAADAPTANTISVTTIGGSGSCVFCSAFRKASSGRDAASKVSQILFEEATDISFYVGKAVNPAHEYTDLPFNFNLKMNIAEQLSAALEKLFNSAARRKDFSCRSFMIDLLPLTVCHKRMPA